MAGLLLPVPALRAVDPNGVPLSGALLQFYLTGTTTPTPVYTSAALTTPLSNPVISDSAGLFPPIFRDPTITYRAQLKTGAGVLVQDIDPIAAPFVNAAGSITGAMLGAGAALANLGFTPLNKAGDTATNLLLVTTALAANSAGFLGAPQNTQNANYTFAATDAGGSVICSTPGGFTWTIPPTSSVPWPLGTVILVRNRAGGSITLLRGTGVVLRLTGSPTTKDVTLTTWGMASLYTDSTNEWTASGTGIS